MPNTTIKYRDGTSKFHRAPAGLDPAGVLIDGRSTSDWLAFAQEYAGELVYFNQEDRSEGTWTPLLYPNREAYEKAVLDEQNNTGNPEWWPSNWQRTVEQYLEDPQRTPLTEKQQELVSRPHFSLFLIFLKLLKRVQEQVNAIPQRHLDFYFQEFLKMLKKPPQPDHLHVIAELAKGSKQALLPKSTPLDAGKASNGSPLIYYTDRDVWINKTQVEKLHTLFISTEGPLYAIADPVSAASEDRSGFPVWKTFGREPESGETATIPTGRLGFLIASPLLYLEGGSRFLDLVINFTTDIDDLEGKINNQALRFTVSTSEGMKILEPGIIYWIEIDKTQLKIKLAIPDTFPSITPLSIEEASLNKAPKGLPILAILLNPEADPSAFTLYPELRKLEIASLILTVNVGGIDKEVESPIGLPNLRLQNDEETIDPKKPFEPFTSRPRKGSGFYITHPEIACKKLEKLNLKFSWANFPDGYDTGNYYDDYWKVGPTTQPKNFLDTTISCIDRGKPTTLKSAEPIFKSFFESTNTLSGLSSLPFNQAPEEVVNAQRFISIRLLSALGHDFYPVLLNLQIREGLKEEPSSWWLLNLNPPFAPQLLSLELKYTASANFTLENQDELHLYHLHPFGYRQAALESGLPIEMNGEVERGIPFFPIYGNWEEETPSNSGALYMGLANLAPPQSLSILFQLAEGSANPESARQTVQWSFLSHDRWIDLVKTGNLISDDTMGLIRSGIIQVRIPKEASSSNNLLPDGLHWLRARVEAFPDAVCDTIAIHTQAVRATVADPALVSGYLEKEQVKGLKRPVAGIAKILQPYVSQGGRPAENESQFYIRISERLRHKQRAISLWDYERLVLENFPEIYKVKCLPADSPGQVGTVRLIVIPDIRGGKPYDPFAPKVPADMLESIRLFLEDYMPATAKVVVLNPAFDRIQIRVLVRLKPEYLEEDYYREQIDLALQQFLSPWAFDPGTDIVFGGRLYVSLLVNFIEELEYVDYVKNLYIKKTNLDSGEAVSIGSNQSYLEASSPNHILVSAPQHHVLILPADPGGQPLKGINYMIVEFDFQVGMDL